MNKKWKLGIDIDGTVTDPETFIPYLNKAFNKKLAFHEITQFNLAPLYGIPEEEFYTWLAANEGPIYAAAPAARQAKEILEQLSRDHHLIYISARGKQHHSLTIQWFETNKIPYHDITLIGSHQKIEAAREYNVHFFLEDKLDNANELAEELEIPIVLFNTPYNQGNTHTLVHRVPDWSKAHVLLQEWMN